MKDLRKLILLIASTALIVACQGRSPSEEKPSSKEATPSSEVAPASSETSSNGGQTSNNNPVSSTQTSVSFNDELQSDPKTCSNHILETIIRVQPTILQRGIERKKCIVCGGFTEKYIYKLDEFAFESTTYLYDGQERELLISGVLPYGTTVQYENNKLTQIGTKEATAKVYSPDNELLVSKTATIAIVENIGMPNVRITTEDGTDPDWHTQSDGSRLYKNMTATVDNCANEYKMEEIPGQIKVRGNSTNQESVAKRAFRLKFTNKVNMLGLNEGMVEKSWVLLADFFDQSNFRNSSAFVMGNSLFNYSGYYCSDFERVTLYMNGENRGVYLLAEQQQAKPKRIPINEPGDGEVGTNIGYLLEIDGLVSQQGNIGSNGLGTVEGDPCFKTDSAGRVNNVNISDKPYVIKTDTWNDTQRLFIKKYMSNCTKAFANVCNGTLQVVDNNGDLKDSPYDNAYDTLNSFMDLDSFFRMFLLQEFMKDYDVGWGSFYMYVDFSSTSKVTRLTMSAPWDFDLGEGNKQSGGGWGGWGGWGGQQSSSDNDIPTSGISSTQDNFLSSSEYTNGMTTFNPWLYLLSQTNFSNDMFKKYYSIFEQSGIYNRMIDDIAYERSVYLTAFNDNHTRYGKGASGATLMQTRQYDSFKDAVDYLVKWFGERKTYLDNKYLK